MPWLQASQLVLLNDTPEPGSEPPTKNDTLGAVAVPSGSRPLTRDGFTSCVQAKIKPAEAP
ncbi:hypothetical protein KSD_28930 [Ktedonobacter sp. SOSP1-85]|nr:hypothetical protein KSD_28930 [Ktedonobacter sp. SOSP1-85]